MKRFLVVVLTLALVLAVSMSAMAAQGTWTSYAADGTGSLSTGSQFAYQMTSRTGPVTQVAANWTVRANDDLDAAINKGADYSNTVGGAWSINDNNSILNGEGGATYQKTVITPGTFDGSRGIVMARIKVNSASSVNTTFGISLGNAGGVQLGLRNDAWRIRDGEGGNLPISDPANMDTNDWRVYAIAWNAGIASVYFSNGTDWSANSSDWTLAATGGIPTATTSIWDGTANVKAFGIVLFDGSSGNQWNGDISWVAHSTYDNIDGQMTPWDTALLTAVVTPEPGSILALCSGLIGIVGFARRRRA